MRMLITGGAGFLGHHLCEFLLRTTDAEIVSLDRLDTSGNLNRLTDLECWEREKTRVKIVFHDLRAVISEQLVKQIGPVDEIIHLAAMTHVDRSIENPEAAVLDNVLGTCHLLDFARQCPQLQHVLLMSTDETFGPSPDGIAYKEWDRHRPGNPYAATKCAAEDLGLAYHNTYKLPVRVVKGMNLFGQRQHVEKYVPNTIRKVRDGELVTVHADPTCIIPGRRSYIHARNVADALLFVLKHGEDGEKYCVVGEKEVDNLAMAQRIADIVGRPLSYRLVDFHSSRPGHDLAYRLDGSKMAAMGWKPPVGFEQSLERVVRWSLDHPEWL